MFQQLVSLILVVAMVLVPQTSFAQSPQIHRPNRSRTSETVVLRATAALPFCQAVQRGLAESAGLLLSGGPTVGLVEERLKNVSPEVVLQDARNKVVALTQQIEAWGTVCAPVYDRLFMPLAEQATNHGSFAVSVGGFRRSFNIPPTPSQMNVIAGEVNVDERVLSLLRQSTGEYRGLAVWSKDLAQAIRDAPNGGVIADPKSPLGIKYDERVIAGIGLLATVFGAICAVTGASLVTSPTCVVFVAAGVVAAAMAFSNSFE